MTVYRFPEIKYRAEKSGLCTACTKRTRRQTTFYQTLNPFNTNADGSLKTSHEINAELAAEAKTWKAQPLLCPTCEADAR